MCQLVESCRQWQCGRIAASVGRAHAHVARRYKVWAPQDAFITQPGMDINLLAQSPVFMVIPDSKTVHRPVPLHVPRNPGCGPNGYGCAASMLLQRRATRLAAGANLNDPMYIHPYTRRPLSTSVVNAKLQGAVRCLAERKGLPPQLAEGFSLKSARKAVASHLSASGCSPQVVAQRLGHGSLQSQMHYICKFFGMRPNLLSVIYQGL